MNDRGDRLMHRHRIFARLAMVVALCSAALAFGAAPSEVGDRLFVAEPHARPLLTTQGGSRIWNCEGMVAQKLIDIVHSELMAIAQNEAIPKPMPQPCHYKIGTLKVMGKSITMYSIDFYTSAASMEGCLVRDRCTDFRSMNFMLKDGKLHRQYMVTNLEKRLTRMVCVDMKGDVVNSKGGCQ
ncbi:MAG: hypothetical protein WCK08_14135 [Betaproteobacteria bacterium]